MGGGSGAGGGWGWGGRLGSFNLVAFYRESDKDTEDRSSFFWGGVRVCFVPLHLAHGLEDQSSHLCAGMRVAEGSRSPFARAARELSFARPR